MFPTRLTKVKLKVNEENCAEIKVAKAMLRAISGVSSNPVIAGGAVRDWHLGRTCNDVDIFIPEKMTKGKQQYNILTSMLTNLLDVQFEEIGDHEKYSDEDGEWMVLQFHYKSVRFQLILGQDPFSSFQHDISKFFMLHDCHCIADPSAIEGFKLKQFKGDTSDKYIQKMQEHYPDIKFLSAKDAELYVHLDNKLEEEDRKPARTEEHVVPVGENHFIWDEARPPEQERELPPGVHHVRAHQIEEQFRHAQRLMMEARMQRHPREQRVPGPEGFYQWLRGGFGG